MKWVFTKTNNSGSYRAEFYNFGTKELSKDTRDKSQDLHKAGMQNSRQAQSLEGWKHSLKVTIRILQCVQGPPAPAMSTVLATHPKEMGHGSVSRPEPRRRELKLHVSQHQPGNLKVLELICMKGWARTQYGQCLCRSAQERDLFQKSLSSKFRLWQIIDHKKQNNYLSIFQLGKRLCWSIWIQATDPIFPVFVPHISLYLMLLCKSCF